ncbi:MAG: hypothetical protein WBL63_18745 [Candidatus Acidiferrum sp.]
MKKETRMVFSALAGLLLSLPATVWSQPATTTHSTRQTATEEQSAPQTQSVTGTIAEVGKSSFTLTVGAAISNNGQQMKQATPKSMVFLIDKNTTVDGKLQVGANADVTYREDNGKNLAISVRVS